MAGMHSLGTLRVFPPEILSSITALLDTAEVWRLRSVSKAFNAHLSDDHVMLHALKKHDSDVTLDNIAEKARIFRSHYTGVPQAALNIDITDFDVESTPVLEGERLAYRTGKVNIRVINLETGAALEVGSSSAFHMIVLTNKFVGSWQRSRVCTFWNLQQLREESLEVADNIWAMAGYENRIALITWPRRTTFELLIYDIDKGAWLHRILVECLQDVDEAPVLAMNDQTCLVVWLPGIERSNGEMPHRSGTSFVEIAQVNLITGSCKRYSLDIQCDKDKFAQCAYIRPAGMYNTWVIGAHYHVDCVLHHGCLSLKRDGHDWQELPVRGWSTAYWKGMLWTASGYAYRPKQHLAFITTDRNVHWSPEQDFNGKIAQNARQRPTHGPSFMPMDLMVSEKFLVGYNPNVEDFTVYAFGNSSLPKTDLEEIATAQLSLRSPGTVQHCWSHTAESMSPTLIDQLAEKFEDLMRWHGRS